jgi:GNAT superfamily N-acetyltransferase
MDDAQLMATMFRSLRASAELIEMGAPATRLLKLKGVTAVIAPDMPERSVMNSVVYETPAALEAALDQLADAYEDVGVRAWTVWVSEQDPEASALLAAAGHKLDAIPTAMAIELEELPPRAGEEPEWSGDWDLHVAGLINDQAYGDAEGGWESVLGQLPEGCAHLYLARLDGEPASFVMVHDHEGDCVFWFAATTPAAQGRGLASGLLHRALLDGRERGCRTSTTQATAMGRPVYERIGYRSLGTLEMWERRR